MADEGWVYCMSNPAMPGFVKVGMTSRNPHERAAELYTTGVPFEFIVEFAKKVKNYTAKEKQLHELLEKLYERPNPNREFFKCSSTDVYELFELMDGVYMDKADRPNPLNLRRYEFKQ
jgi:hypothetical protein